MWQLHSGQLMVRKGGLPPLLCRPELNDSSQDSEIAARIDFITSLSRSASSNIRIAATPRAPDRIQSATLPVVSPPSAKTGNGANSALTRARLFNPCAAPYCFSPTTCPCFLAAVSKTGPNTTKSAPSRRARLASANECVDTPIKKPLPNALRTTSACRELVVRCTPSAPAAAATSARSFTSKRVALPLVRPAAFATSSYSTFARKFFSRIWTRSISASTAASISCRIF